MFSVIRFLLGVQIGGWIGLSRSDAIVLKCILAVIDVWVMSGFVPECFLLLNLSSLVFACLSLILILSSLNMVFYEKIIICWALFVLLVDYQLLNEGWLTSGLKSINIELAWF